MKWMKLRVSPVRVNRCEVHLTHSKQRLPAGLPSDLCSSCFCHQNWAIQRSWFARVNMGASLLYQRPAVCRRNISAAAGYPQPRKKWQKDSIFRRCTERTRDVRIGCMCIAISCARDVRNSCCRECAACSNLNSSIIVLHQCSPFWPLWGARMLLKTSLTFCLIRMPENVWTGFLTVSNLIYVTKMFPN